MGERKTNTNYFFFCLIVKRNEKNDYFCSVNKKRRNSIISKFLLAVFLPALLLSSFHHHATEDAVEDECVECAAHLPHVAHINASAGPTLDCVFCHFLSLIYLSPIAVTALRSICGRHKSPFLPIDHVRRCAHVVISLRAPPVR